MAIISQEGFESQFESDNPPTVLRLVEQGLTCKQSMGYQKLAAIPQDRYQEAKPQIIAEIVEGDGRHNTC